MRPTEEETALAAPPATPATAHAWAALALLTVLYALSWFHRMVLTMFLEPIGQ